jgi:hypothetical protein
VVAVPVAAAGGALEVVAEQDDAPRTEVPGEVDRLEAAVQAAVDDAGLAIEASPMLVGDPVDVEALGCAVVAGPALAGEVDAVVALPPLPVAGVEGVSPRGGLPGGVDGDYARFALPLPPAADSLAVVGAEARPAGEDDDGSPAVSVGFFLYDSCAILFSGGSGSR